MSHNDAVYSDYAYDMLVQRVQARFAGVTAALEQPALFTTNTTDLFETYLDALPAAYRQHHNCTTCRRFFETYSGLVTIDDDGATRAALWPEPDGAGSVVYRDAVSALYNRLRGRRATGVFLSDQAVWGAPALGRRKPAGPSLEPVSGGAEDLWTHFAVTPPPALIYRSTHLTPSQAMAAKAADFDLVVRTLAKFSLTTVSEALRVIDSDALQHGAKARGPVQWLHDLHRSIQTVRSRVLQGNLIWRAVATAPAGFIHSSLADALMEDISSGLSFEEVSRRFAAKTNPTQYQRPQAPATAGNIAAAEKLVERLGIARSLPRRFARLDEVEAIWRPTPAAATPDGGSVFGHLTPKKSESVQPLAVPRRTLTWEKFRRTVLPAADAIACYAPPTGFYVALTTAVNADAPPILQWDDPDRRNPVAWYTHAYGSAATRWGLRPSTFVPVTAITLSPALWGLDSNRETRSRFDLGAILLLADAADTTASGNALFPETLRSELHQIRATIEAYARAAELEGRDQASACGLAISTKQASRSGAQAVLRVTAAGAVSEYEIDRWD